MATERSITFFDDFRRPQSYSTTPGQNGWTFKETGTSGTPTCANTSDGCVLSLTSDSELQVATLYHNDIRVFRLEDLEYIEWSLKVSGIDSVTDLVAGLASDQNNALDSVQESLWFRVAGASSVANLVGETDDNTTNIDDQNLGATVQSVIRRLRLDLRNGLGDVRFSVDGLRRAPTTTFDMQAISSNLMVQPYVQLQKASGSGVPSALIRSCEIKYSTNY